ncbi:alpha/beta fold hydrolase [Acinetobacter sp. AYS6]|uniref:alpha/beta fold hydrolase n=1 Tax=Acinetobacter sp. AYS6 TaxID=2983297 RepID=UPI0021D67288|nr:alpha/beta fold hydrolase [Acinetobacter sp. AYS6]MCU7696969.1 alpha/beta fold hydrolase [Acinetobacter sp. AYS6]
MNSQLLTRQYVASTDVKLAVYQWGTENSSAGTIVLVHGYPDSAEVWKKIATLLAKDFHVVAYDVRGTGASSKPKSKQQYQFSELVQDLSAVIDFVSPDKPVHLVGHDWGALQCWEGVLDDKLKHQVSSYVALAPSLDHVGWWFQRKLQQKNLNGYLQFAQRAIGSSYMGLMLLPILPELTWQMGLTHLWPKLVSKLERTTVVPDSSQHANAVNGIQLYRLNLVELLKRPTTRKTSIPVNMLIMTKDPFVPEMLCQGLEEWVENIEYNQVEAGHWGILSKPDEVAGHIAQFVNQHI